MSYGARVSGTGPQVAKAAQEGAQITQETMRAFLKSPEAEQWRQQVASLKAAVLELQATVQALAARMDAEPKAAAKVRERAFTRPQIEILREIGGEPLVAQVLAAQAAEPGKRTTAGAKLVRAVKVKR